MANQVVTLEEIEKAIEKFKAMGVSGFLRVGGQDTKIYIIVSSEDNP